MLTIGENKKMSLIVKLVILISIMLLGLVIPGYGQKGMGAIFGVSSKSNIPNVITLVGNVEEVKSGPCKYSKGRRASSGTHLIIRSTSDEELNVHLGPTGEVADIVADIEGKQIDMKLFRTKKLPLGHYIAKEIEVEGKNSILRDAYLKPVWSSRRIRKLRRTD